MSEVPEFSFVLVEEDEGDYKDKDKKLRDLPLVVPKCSLNASTQSKESYSNQFNIRQRGMKYYLEMSNSDKYTKVFLESLLKAIKDGQLDLEISSSSNLGEFLIFCSAYS